MPIVSLPQVTSHESPALFAIKRNFRRPLYIECKHSRREMGAYCAKRTHRPRLGVPLVATNNVISGPRTPASSCGERDPHGRDYLLPWFHLKSLPGEAWFKPAAEMQNVVPDHPEWLQARWRSPTAAICNSNWDLIIPSLPFRRGETPDSYLQQLSLEGALKRYQLINTRSAFAATRELRSSRSGPGAYFLLVWTSWKKRGGAGFRGGARVGGKLLVTYCLGNFLRVSVCAGGWYFDDF